MSPLLSEGVVGSIFFLCRTMVGSVLVGVFYDIRNHFIGDE